MDQRYLEKALPCPFCGSSRLRICRNDGRKYVYSWVSNTADVIECQDCHAGAWLDIECGNSQLWRKNKSLKRSEWPTLVVSHWNHRNSECAQVCPGCGKKPHIQAFGLRNHEYEIECQCSKYRGWAIKTIIDTDKYIESKLRSMWDVRSGV